MIAPDLSLLTALEAALLPHANALEAAGAPSHDAEASSPDEHTQHHEACDCPACALFVAEVDAIVAEHRAEAIQHQEDRFLLGLDVAPGSEYPDLCPLALIDRSGVAEGRARYARTPNAPRARHAGRPRFVPTAPVRRAAVWA